MNAMPVPFTGYSDCQINCLFMKKTWLKSLITVKTAFLLMAVFTAVQSFSQAPAFYRRLPIGDFAVYAEGGHPSMMDSAVYGVLLRKKIIINGGHVGSNFFVNVLDSGTYHGNFFSGERIKVGNANTFNGNFHINNAAGVAWPVLRADQFNKFGITNPAPSGGLIASRGNVQIGPNSIVNGPVFLTPGYNYQGPPPTNGVLTDTSSLPIMPLLPYVTPFPPFSGNNIVNTTTNLAPGNYGDLILNGATLRTITFTTPGTYVFKSINLTGKNVLNFLFPTGTKGYRIYVHGDVNLGQVNTKTDGNFVLNNPLAARIFMEVHGGVTGSNGGFAFRLLDAAPPNESNWVGTVYAPFAGIQVGNNHPTYVDGALWSKRRVEIGNNVVINLIKLITPRTEIDPYYPAPTGGKADNTQPKIGSELYSLVNYRTTIDTITTNTIFQLDSTTEKVSIEVVAQDGQYTSAYNYLVSKGLVNIIPNNTGNLVIAGDFPIDSLTLLNSQSNILFVRPLLVPLNNAGIVTSQGDGKQRSDIVRSAYKLTGNGVKVGVISDSYNNKSLADADVESDDLPGDVQVVKEYPGTSGTDEGRAMLQIVHDVAPGAKLAFRTGTVSASDFASGIKELASANLSGGACNVIVDDVTWPTEPFFRDGTVAQAVNTVKAQGVTYFSAAGNFGSRAFEADFNSSGVTPEGLTGPAHSFGSEIYQKLSLKAGTYTIVLQWDDDVYSLGGNQGAQTDLDVYLLEFGGTTLFGFNRDNTGGDPIEILPFVVNEDTEAKLAIVRASGSANPRFKFVIFRGDGTIVGGSDASSTLVGQANAEGAIAVGAMLYDNISPYVTTPNTVASFSSRGGTQVKVSSQFTTRQKPELVAPNGVNTKVSFGSTDIENDGLPNFFGTSAAAPHAAGVAALLIEGKKKFNLQSSVTPDEIRSLLTSTADDLHDSGYDVYSGYGLINAETAVRSLANPTPSIISVIATDSTDPGKELDIPGINTGFSLMVKGENLEPSTKIYFGGAILNTYYIDENKVWAVVDTFTGNPTVKLYTGPKSISTEDGGYSDSLNLYDNKRIISIKINNASRKYGQNNPVFSSTITVDGTPIDSTTFSLAALGLDKIVYSTTAVASSPVYTYPINASLNLDAVADSQLIAENVYQFSSAGVLTVNRLPVKITPQDKTLSYGDELGVVSYNYEFDQSDLADPTGMMDAVKSIHKNYLADNALAVIHGFNTPLANNYTLTASDIGNMSTMASFQSMRNARRFKVFDGKLAPLTDSVTDEEFGLQRMIIDVSAQSIYNYKSSPSTVDLVAAYNGTYNRSLVNAKTLANGTSYVTVNGQLMAMVNGQLMAMVNKDLMSLVNGQLMAMVNGQLETVESLSLQNGQLMAMVNGQLMAMVNGQLMAMVNGVAVNIDINSDIVEVNGQLMAMVNGQLMAMVNGQLMAMVNGQLMAMVNGQLMAMVNGQLMAMVNGQLMAMVNGELTVADNLSIQNGQLMAMVNGQLMAMVNGQLMAMVNGQLIAMVNGQLMAMVNNEVEFVQEVSMVNGQLMAMVNGQLMAMVNGQLMAMVNNEVVTLDNISIVNGQLMAMVNGQLMAMVNGQLMAMVNGQLMAMVNGSTYGGTNSNTNTVVIVDNDDIDVQGGAIGGMASVNMITGLDVGVQKLIPGTFSDDNFEVSYGLGEVTINPATLSVTVKDTARKYGEANPAFTVTISGYTNGDDSTAITAPAAATTATQSSPAGTYPVTLSGVNATNYIFTYVNGTLTVNPVNLTIKVNDTSKVYGQVNPQFSLSVTGFVNGDNTADITLPSINTTATTGSPAGAYPVTLSGGNAANYVLALQDGTLTVNKAPLTIIADDQSKIYGQLNPPLTLTVNGFVNGESVNSITLPQVTTVANGSPAGTYPIVLSGGVAANYDIILQDGTLTISKAQLTLVANDVSKIYGQPNPSLTIAANGFVNGDGLNNIAVPQVSTAAGQNSAVGTYPVVLSGGSAANYEIILQNGVLKIEPALLTIKANDLTKAYGAANPPLTMTITGFVNGDDLGDITVPSITTNATVSSSAGIYPVILSGGSATNYSMTLVNGSLRVGKFPLCITADMKVINQGQSLPVFTSAIKGLLNGDIITGISYSASAVNAAIAGEYNNMPSVNPAAYPQYEITFKPGKLYVNPYGNGAKKIIVKRECVRKLAPAVNGYQYAAVFSYENPNSAPFYVAKGSNNNITIDNGGSFENNLPEVFLPGYHEITIPFSGHQMRWSVTTLGSTHNTANTAANNVSNNCSASIVSRGETNEDRNELLSLYPNPATRSVFISGTSPIDAKDIAISDIMGNTSQVRIIHSYSSQTELDVSRLRPGSYFIRVRSGDGTTRVFKFIKQ
jgi:hypothetical protein